MTQHPLSHPPGYEYVSTGPWFVSHLDENERTHAWIIYMAESAVLRFWYAVPGTAMPPRRVVVDSLGITVLGVDRTQVPEQVVGTREMMELTLKMTRQARETGPEQELAILGMIESLRMLDGRTL